MPLGPLYATLILGLLRSLHPIAPVRRTNRDRFMRVRVGPAVVADATAGKDQGVNLALFNHAQFEVCAEWSGIDRFPTHGMKNPAPRKFDEMPLGLN